MTMFVIHSSRRMSLSVSLSLSLSLSVLFFLVVCVPSGESTSYSLVTSGKPYCRTAELAKDTFVKILFDSPDLVLDESSDKYGPSYVTISERPVESAVEFLNEGKDDPRHDPHHDHRHRRPPPLPPPPIKPISHEMKQIQGSFVHHVKVDAEVSVCIRASTAGSRNPMRFGVRLEELGDEERAESELPPAADVDHHLSFVETQLNRMESQMHAVKREADFARERDSIYHGRTDAMHKATLFWPIMHVGILLVTGFTQANHIVQFFKKRRII